jgi:PD-(D/E)XK nuclease superfamily protein
MDIDLGPQAKSGRRLQKNARLLQSHYRATVLKQDYGSGPNKNSANKYGNMLIDGDLSGANFLTKEVFDYAKWRVANKGRDETIDEYRLFNNMLSSMPMCFNLFVPMREAVLRGEQWVTDVFQILFPQYDIAQVREIRLEFIPVPINEYTNDKSAFDAWLEFSAATGNRGIIGIETKYTDSLGKNSPRDMSTKLAIAEECGCFTADGITSIRRSCPQIIRNYLLTEKYRIKHRLEHSHSLILSPEEDYEVVEEIEGFKRLMNPYGKSKISKISLEDFTDAVLGICPEQHRAWIEEFIRRYLDWSSVDSV